MNGVVAAPAVCFAGALCCLASIGRPALARVLGPGVTVVACLVGLPAALAAMGGAAVGPFDLPWQMPLGSISLAMDALSAVFATAILVVSALSAIYGSQYLRAYEEKKDLAASWFFFNVLVGSMLVVVEARNAMLFLLAWELMSLASFFLVMFEHERESVRRAGWTYLVATHIGTAFLLVLFVLLGRQQATLNFSGFFLGGDSAPIAGVMFVLAVIGFGTKAGFMPLHVWLPEAHPAAPSHVSAVMSGVMIKTGVYGLLRVLTFLGPPALWWGWTLVVIGTVSGVLGVLFALAQQDLKRLLAYSSVENVGIITVGVGVGTLGASCGNSAMQVLGFGGALLHVLNHAAFKSLLFLGAGSVVHATGTREIDRLGGLLKRMPATGLAFALGCVAICGLPPLNGFVSEFMIYLAALAGLTASPKLPVAALAVSPVVLAGLALVALAVACFTKAFGMVFLGEPRDERAAHAHEAGLAMRIPMLALAATCVAIGFTGPWMLRAMQPAIAIATGSGGAIDAATRGLVANLGAISLAAVGLVTLIATLTLLRKALLRSRPVTQAVTWDCGYAAPTARMQYTGSSYARPITRLFRVVLRAQRKYAPPAGLFPQSSSFSIETPDVYQESVYRPVFAAAERVLGRFRVLQHGRVNLYILCIVLALLALLAWKLR